MKRVLIVDDMKSWREFNKNIVKELFTFVEIVTADSAREAYDKLLENNETPFDVVITDLQMEDDFSPKYAGEWLVEQIKTFKNYINTKIIMISASYNIRVIAENLGVSCIPKGTAIKCFSAYKELLL